MTHKKRTIPPMSRYTVKGFDPSNQITVGYTRRFSSYWITVETPEGETLLSEPGELLTLHDLVAYSWGTVDWPSEADVLRQLRDDAAWVDQAAHDGKPGEVTRVLSAALLG